MPLLASRGVHAEIFDANQDLIDEETRRDVSKKFGKAVFNLVNKE